MFMVTQHAQEKITEYFKGKEIQPIRVFLTHACSGPQLAMMIDQHKEADKMFKINGFEFLIEKEFLKQAQPIEVDFGETGFRITSSLELDGCGCSGCGSTGSCG